MCTHMMSRKCTHDVTLMHASLAIGAEQLFIKAFYVFPATDISNKHGSEEYM